MFNPAVWISQLAWPTTDNLTLSPLTRGGDDAIKAEAFDWHDRVELGSGVAVTLVPTRHWSARGLFDRNQSLWASFVLETPAGDRKSVV